MNKEFIEALSQLEKEKGISKQVLLDTMEAALISAYKRNYGANTNVGVTIDGDTGEIHVYTLKTVVEEVENPTIEISLEDAKQLNARYELGDITQEEVIPRDFGRVAAQTAKQVVVQRLHETERDMEYAEISQQEGEVVNATVQKIVRKNVYVSIGKTETVLDPKEQVPGETYQPHERIKLYVAEVRRGAKDSRVIVSRTHPGLVKRLFEQQVPEIHDGIVEIKGIAREAGSRTKIAVWSKDESVDPVGACVGQRGTRVQNIVDELRGEKIDIIQYSENPVEYISAALNPAKVLNVVVNEENHACTVTVADQQLSLAIGKEGQNARLVAKLTGWKIDIQCEKTEA